MQVFKSGKAHENIVRRQNAASPNAPLGLNKTMHVRTAAPIVFDDCGRSWLLIPISASKSQGPR